MKVLLNRAILLVALMCLIQVNSFAGEGKITPRKANELYQRENYNEALEYYKYLVKADETNIEYNLRLGVCYLKTTIDKGLAIPYFKRVVDLDALDGNVNYSIAFYLLGKAYHYDEQFDLAITTFEKFLDQENITEEDVEFAKQKIQFCYNANELLKFPVNVEFKNLGENINSEYEDYYPHIPSDESFIVFNSKRKDFAERMYDGSYTSNVYIADVENGEFKKARLLGGKLNTKYYNEAIIGMSANGKNGIFYIDNEDDLIDLFSGDIKNHKVENIEVLNSQYNSNDLEIAASISSDGNTLYIASKRYGGFGGSDIYRAKLLPTGEWGKLMNLGPEINTPYDDVFPNISPDEKTLYFSSEGHTSMGDLDIFRAEWDEKENKWTSIKNIGYPINTPMDDMNFRVSSSGKYGYISTLKPGGFGSLDVYRVTFNDIDPDFTVLAGKIYTVNTNQILKGVNIEVISNTDEFYGSYVPNTITGRYVIILAPGSYTVTVTADGYKDVIRDVNILDKSDFKTFIEQDLILKPENILDEALPMEQGEAESLIINN